MEGPGTPEVRSSRLAGAVMVALAAAFILAALPVPFGAGLDRTSALYVATFSQSWDQQGFLASAGIPTLLMGDRELTARRPYLNHPVASWWLYYLAQAVPAPPAIRYRLLPCLITTATALLVGAAAARLLGPWAGAGATALFLATPLISINAIGPYIELPALAASVATVLAWDRWRRGDGKRGRTLLWVLFAAGCLCDWCFYLLLPGLALVERRSSPRGGPRCGIAMLLASLAFAAAIVAHLASGVGSWARVLAELRAAASVATGAGDAPFLSAQGHWLATHFTPAGLALAGLAALGLLRRRDAAESRLLMLAAPLALQAAMTIVIFRGRSHDHGYFWMHAAAPYALSCVAGLHAWLRKLRPAAARARPAAALVLAAVCATGVVSSRSSLSTYKDDELRRIASLADDNLGRETLVLTPDPVLVEGHLYSAADWMPVGGIEQVEAVLRARDEGRLGYARIVLASRPEALEPHPGLKEALEARLGAGTAHLVGAPGLFVLEL